MSQPLGTLSRGRSPRITIRIAPEELASLDSIAGRNNLDRSGLIRLLVQRGLRAEREAAAKRATKGASGSRPGDC